MTGPFELRVEEPLDDAMSVLGANIPVINEHDGETRGRVIHARQDGNDTILLLVSEAPS